MDDALSPGLLKLAIPGIYRQQQEDEDAYTEHFSICSDCRRTDANRDDPCEVGKPLYDTHRSSLARYKKLAEVVSNHMADEEYYQFRESMEQEYCASIGHHPPGAAFYAECPMCDGYSILGDGCLTCNIVIEPQRCDTSYCEWWKTPEGQQLLGN